MRLLRLCVCCCWNSYDKFEGVVSVSGCAVEYPVARYNRTSSYVLCLLTPRAQVQIVMNVTVHAPMRLEKYPYDRHVIPFCLASRATKDADGTLIKRKLCEKWPEWAPTSFSEDKFMLLESQTTPDLEYSHKQCFAYLDGKKARSFACSLSARPRTS